MYIVKKIDGDVSIFHAPIGFINTTKNTDDYFLTSNLPVFKMKGIDGFMACDDINLRVLDLLRQIDFADVDKLDVKTVQNVIIKKIKDKMSEFGIKSIDNGFTTLCIAYKGKIVVISSNYFFKFINDMVFLGAIADIARSVYIEQEGEEYDKIINTLLTLKQLELREFNKIVVADGKSNEIKVLEGLV